MTYSEPWWREFRVWFSGQLGLLGIPRICGATMPDGPKTNPSECKRDGLFTDLSSKGDLHFHHEPELTEAEKQDRTVVCQKERIVLLCDRCHDRTTGRMSGARRCV